MMKPKRIESKPSFDKPAFLVLRELVSPKVGHDRAAVEVAAKFYQDQGAKDLYAEVTAEMVTRDAEAIVASAATSAPKKEEKAPRSDFREKLAEGAVPEWNTGRWRGKITIDAAEKYRAEKGLDLLNVEDLDAVAEAMAAKADKQADGEPATVCGLAEKCTSKPGYTFQPFSKNIVFGDGTVLSHDRGDLRGVPVRTGQYMVREGLPVVVCQRDMEALRDLQVKFYDRVGAQRVADAIKRTADKAAGLQEVAAGAERRGNKNAPRPSKTERHTGWNRGGNMRHGTRG